MARIKLVYIGGGSTRAPGTMASFVERGQSFAGSEVALVDLDEERLELVRLLATKMARAKGIDLRITATTDRRSALENADAVLTSFRPGGFEARYLDESIPLKHGVIGQETQGPGGFFMALRSIHVMKGIVRDMEAVSPRARLFNYTNPVNIVAEAVTHHSDIPTVSLCEGPLIYPREVARFAGLDPDRVSASMIGLNHGSWSVQHEYDGRDVIPLIEEHLRNGSNGASAYENRLLRLTATMGSIPSSYFQYYYFKEEILNEMQNKATTRAQDIMARVSDYWAHYREQASSDNPVLERSRSRGGLHELELAFDVMDALYNDLGQTWPVNVPNAGAISNLPKDLVVEVPGYVDKDGVRPIDSGALPKHVAGLVEMLGEYQGLTARAAWEGSRGDAVRALASHPLVFSLPKAIAIYDEMSAAHRNYLPERLAA